MQTTNAQAQIAEQNAIRLLRHYFEQAGVARDLDSDTEIREIVESIIEAICAELAAQIADLRLEPRFR